MAIHVALTHITHYRYDRPVTLGPQIVRLRPAPHSRSRVLSFSQRVEPDPHFVNWQQDPFANYQARLVFPEPVREFKVSIDLVVEMATYNPFDFFLEPSAGSYPIEYEAEEAIELAPYRSTIPLTPLFETYVNSISRSPQATIDFLVEVNRRVQQDVSYLVRMQPGVQTPEETLTAGSGSCRDSSWMLVQLMRRLGLAARFVSGYLIQLKSDVVELDGPSGPEADFTDLHAWCEVYLPGAGWVGLDPTSGLLAGEGHIPLACTPTPSSAAPIEGAVGKSEVEFSHVMRVDRVYESPRVTAPYAEEQWQEILALGDRVDERLEAGDVRLTMGGEPTFVANSDRDAAEWNIDAVGPTKRKFAYDMASRLRTHYAPGGLLHLGQGKWYPGEQLPRWAMSIYWRGDGQPVWHNVELLASETDKPQHTADDAGRLVQAIARALGVSNEFIRPAFEDSEHYASRTAKLPINVEIEEARSGDSMEDLRLRRVTANDVEQPVGHLLPLHVDDGWSTGPWLLRSNRLQLVPGDSPMGFRLPLASLPWVSEADFPYHHPLDPWAERGPLSAPSMAAMAASVGQPPGGGASGESRVPRVGESAAWLTRTALCVEVRDPQRANGPDSERKHDGELSQLYVFMPPLPRLEDYLELVSAVEAAAQALDLRVTLEGYPPPRDARLTVLQVTPDPGVVEVNIHPAAGWRELVERTEFVYEAARFGGMCAEKFMTDGRHTGTGGGNHFVMGAAQPKDSPFLRRPELLGSLLTHWHNHPSLSYLFSGMFIGPTSQAPRVDEARNDQLYELELALQQIDVHREEHDKDMPPWLVDRTLRNILVDITGNTHRSEFCIDKLYSPDSSTGRLGLLELRAFEMPPHARMSAVQQLLLRALVARFWEQPTRQPLTRWGTQLHDRFMLPTFIRSDFDDVLADLAQAGFEFPPAWFDPHFEFRFPLAGQRSLLGMEISLRHALEPWHVMGEEGMSGATVRYVDSSLERLEVRVTGFNIDRYQLTCNGRALPLQPTGTEGDFVAGVRFKAWNPPSALHPSIDAHSPLIFDLIDRWNQRSLGGCQYHVSHPGGLSYDRLPVNAYEAESRRLSRFFETGHSVGTVEPAAVQVSREFPFTLDLRRG